MPLPLMFKFVDRLATKLTVRNHRVLMRGTMRAAGEHWHEVILPRHFRQDATRRYGYQPRTAKTKARKIALARRGKVEDGGVSPNVWSGLMRRALLDHKTLAIFPSRVTIRMFGPRYTTMKLFGDRDDRTEIYDLLVAKGIKPRFSREYTGSHSQPDKKKEITTVIAPEKQDLARVMKRAYLDELSRLQTQPTTSNIVAA